MASLISAQKSIARHSNQYPFTPNPSYPPEYPRIFTPSTYVRRSNQYYKPSTLLYKNCSAGSRLRKRPAQTAFLLHEESCELAGHPCGCSGK